MAKSVMKLFRKRLFICCEEPKDDQPYLTVYAGVDEMDANETGKLVGIYELVELRQLVVKKELK